MQCFLPGKIPHFTFPCNLSKLPKGGEEYAALILQDKNQTLVCVREKRSLKLEVQKWVQFSLRLKALKSKARILTDCGEENGSFIIELFDLVNLSCGIENEHEYLSQIWYSWICVAPKWYFCNKGISLECECKLSGNTLDWGVFPPS